MGMSKGSGFVPKIRGDRASHENRATYPLHPSMYSWQQGGVGDLTNSRSQLWVRRHDRKRMGASPTSFPAGKKEDRQVRLRKKWGVARSKNKEDLSC